MYGFAIETYKALINAAALFNRKAAEMKEGHRNLIARITDRMAEIREKKPGARTYLFHCASLGEFEQGKPVMDAIREREPDSIMVLTFFSPSGYTAKSDYDKADAVFYLPYDTPKEAEAFAGAVMADVAVIVKYEYWRNIFKAMHRRGTEIYVISALFQEDMCFFNRLVGGFFIEPLRFVTRFFVQDTNSADLLRSIGFANVTVSGDTRFDRVVEITAATPSDRVSYLEGFIDRKRKVLVAGSLWQHDMDHILPFITAHPDIQFVIAPHNINQREIDRWAASLPNGRIWGKFTQMEKNPTGGIPDVIFIDCVGMLSQLYKFADMAFIGGGYDKLGIHNTLEAAVWDKPVAFGPVYSRYIEAVGLVECGGAFVATTPEDFESIWDKVTVPESTAGRTAGDFVRRNSGVTERILKEIK